MKRLALLVSLALLTVVGTAATSQAYYLDTPHNESNGIMCYTCHTAEWYTYTPSGAVDDTLFNYVCLRCHDEVPVDVTHQGPSKHLHASSTTSTDKGTWSTGCSQCHDPHFQGQLDWTGDNGPTGLWLAQGDFGTPSNRVFSAADPLGGGYGTTAVTIDLASVSGQAGWTDTATWASKGGFMPATRATDNSRGLVLVPNKSNPTDTYEIVSVVGTTLKVKGNMPSAPNGQIFGVVYGQSLRSMLRPNGAVSAGQNRDVKFFQPAIITGTYGGYIDETPAATKPLGLCQVCHTNTAYWKKDNTVQNGPTHNINNDPCNDCHDILTGGGGGADHTLFIADDQGTGPGLGFCSDCHGAIVASPASHATNGCQTCHTATTPGINTTPFVGGDLGNSYAALTDNGNYSWNGSSRLQDLSSRTILTAGFTKIKCGECHNTKPGLVGSGGHGGHSSSAFAWDGNCADCHSDGGLGIVEGIHGREVSGSNCKFCHDPVSVDASNYTVRREGDPLNGIDGDARGATTLSACTACHNTNTPAVIHHDSLSGLAAAGNCTANCHDNVGHEGNHTLLVDNYVNCDTCHAANIGGIGGAPVNSSDVKVHDGCVTCHNTNTTLKTLAQVGGTKVIAMPNGGVGTNNGGGTCAACHGEYFASHTNITHLTRVGGDTACNSCHTATAGTATTVPVNAGDNKVHDACTSCHTATGTLKAVVAPGGVGNIAPSASCTGCHGNYFPNHTAANHSTRVAISSYCVNCHDATKGLVSGVPTNGADPKVHDACNTCHNDATNNLLKAAYGLAPDMASPGGDCVACHNTYFVNHLHHELASNTIDATPACAVCHDDGTGTSSARTAPSAPFDGAGQVHGTNVCATCHDIANGSWISLALTRNPSADGNAANVTCIDCHQGTTWEALHTLTATTGTLGFHVGAVDGFAACITCHTATAAVTGGIPVASGDDKVHDGCATCHTANGLPLVSTPTANGWANAVTKGTCDTCHTSYFNSHTHHYGANNELTYNASVDLAQAAPGTGCNSVSCHDQFSFAAFAGILSEHVTGCARCHSYTNADGLGTPPLATNNSAISTAGAKTCISCHTPKIQPATHGGHDPSHFSWAGGCDACHSATPGSPTEAVVQDIHGNVCTTCHTGGGGTGTAKAGDPANGIDGDATRGIGAAPHAGVTCVTCHSPLTAGTAVNAASIGGIHHSTTGAIDNCNTCHGPVDHQLMVRSVGAICDTCHGGITPDTTGNGVPVDPNNSRKHDYCKTCHTFQTAPALDGILVAPIGDAATIDNGGDPARINGTNGGGICTDCHSIATPGGMHHDTEQAAGNNCTLNCHGTGGPLGLGDRRIDHTARVANAGAWTTSPAGCVTCHDLTVGAVTGAPVSVSDSMIHDSCRTCHTFAGDYHGILVNGTGAKGTGTGALPAGNNTCLTCHTGITNIGNSGTMHHSATGGNAAIGQCEFCHTDPRNDGVGTLNANNGTFEETAPTGGVPKHLPCEECHVRPQNQTNGYSGTTMTIYSFNEGVDTQKASTIYNVDYTRATARSGGHLITNTIGKINNWGICFDCHDNSKAVRVLPLHPDPTAFIFSNNTPGPATGSNGYGAYLPGREARNNMGRFDFLVASYRATSTRPGVGNVRSDSYVGEWASAAKYGATIYPASDLVIPNPFAAGTLTVPMFAVQTQDSAPASPAADDVRVTSANYNTGGSTNLVVVGSNTGACTNLTLHYGAASVGMTGAGTCTGTITSANYPADGQFISVTTSNTQGINVLNFPITDDSAPSPASAAADSYSVGTNATTPLDVMSNDSGDNIALVSTNDASLNANCSTAINGTNVDITCGATAGAMGTFQYTIQGSIGGPSVGTVTITSTSNAPPVFGADPFSRPNGNVGVAYSNSIAANASDPESDPMTFSKTAGPAWLSVAANGAITGTPGAGDAGLNVFTVRVDALGGFDTATLNITVDTVAVFDNTQNFVSLSPSVPIASFGSGTGTGTADTVTWTASYDLGTNAWAVDTTTPSGSAGPTGGGVDGAADPFLYTEYTGASATNCYLTSSNLDASTQTLTLSFGFNPNSALTGAGVFVEVNDGAGWVIDTTVVDPATHTAGTQADPWQATGDIVLSGYSSSTMQVRIRFTPASVNFQNDMAFDNIRIRNN